VSVVRHVRVGVRVHAQDHEGLLVCVDDGQVHRFLLSLGRPASLRTPVERRRTRL
jgi:hypothetical protein